MSLGIVLTKKGGKSYKLTGNMTVREIVERWMRQPDGEADLGVEVTLRWTRIDSNPSILAQRKRMTQTSRKIVVKEEKRRKHRVAVEIVRCATEKVLSTPMKKEE